MIMRRLFRRLYARDNDGAVPADNAVMPGSRFAVIDGVGHTAMVAAPSWKTKLKGLGPPYADYAADMAEAIVRWVHSPGSAQPTR